MNTQRLAIVGAGPKALSIAAKAAALKQVGFHVPEIVIFEKKSVAANWNKESGLTNGKLPLGTSPEKDVGFPYASFCWGSRKNEKVNHAMRDFSWQAFLIENYLYSDWIDRGKPAPRHQRWQEYLLWVYEKITPVAQLVFGQVRDLSLTDHQWTISYVDADGIDNFMTVDGVVLTGPGDLKLPNHLPNDDRILPVQRFWRRDDFFTSLKDKTFAVVGNGETAATVAEILGNSDLKVDVITPLAMNYSRGESYVENHVYTDPFQGNWFQLTPENRREFISRTDRGVFSMTAKHAIDSMESIEIIPGRLTSVEIDSLNQLLVNVEYNQSSEMRIYDYVVLAAGFDHYTFLKGLVTENCQRDIQEIANLASFSLLHLEEAIDEHLSIRNLQPKLHLPMLAGLAQGPGFANLSCLGRLSDQILSGYVSLE